MEGVCKGSSPCVPEIDTGCFLEVKDSPFMSDHGGDQAFRLHACLRVVPRGLDEPSKDKVRHPRVMLDCAVFCDD